MKTTAKRISLVLAASLAAGTAFAASHAMEQQKAREDLMKVMGQNLGTLGKMAKGEMDFDSTVASEAATAVHDAAVKVTADEMWEAGIDSETTEGSRALPAIWEDYDDFKAKGAALVTAAEGAQTAAGEGLQALQASMGEMGQACGACHKAYRAPE
ncbi:MAG: cytochrome c [Vannielia sp.]|uniref:c-type cytochrome n=1 Tax=Rhodobacterales TaxID=204455 RepID=UPI00209576E3|nr:cytochrome c [Oceanicola sp. 502str15]MCO6382156.1 cytochrome c [Oceanicola sp. 502str15]